MNPHAMQSSSLVALMLRIKKNRILILQLARREITGRYKGSFLGVGWSFINPLLMLAVYTFLFSIIFKAKWGGPEETKSQFAIVLYAGMIVFSIFSDVLNRATTLIISNTNYVKKVIFPLELLLVVSMFSALISFGINLIVLLLFFLIINGFINWTTFFLPLVLMPLVFLTLGLGWFFACLGVFLRDTPQTVATLTVVVSFMAPIFYPIAAVPEQFQPVLKANPLTFVLEQSRNVIIWGNLPDWWALSCYTLASILISWLGLAWFQKTRKGFADVL